MHIFEKVFSSHCMKCIFNVLIVFIIDQNHYRSCNQHYICLQGFKASSPNTRESSPLNADALVLVSLCGDHDISLVQNKHFDLFRVDELQLNAPVQNRPRCADDDLLLDLNATLH